MAKLWLVARHEYLIAVAPARVSIWHFRPAGRHRCPHGFEHCCHVGQRDSRPVGYVDLAGLFNGEAATGGLRPYRDEPEAQASLLEGEIQRSTSCRRIIAPPGASWLRYGAERPAQEAAAAFQSALRAAPARGRTLGSPGVGRAWPGSRPADRRRPPGAQPVQHPDLAAAVSRRSGVHVATLTSANYMIQAGGDGKGEPEWSRSSPRP